MRFNLPEFVDNPENRCPVVLILDTSASMRGTAIDELNAGIRIFHNQIANDEMASLRVETSIVTFGGDVRLVQDFLSSDDMAGPPELEAWGATPMGEAIDLGLKALEARKSVYRTHGIHYYRPWMFLITDGAPTDGLAWQEAAMRAQEADVMKRLAFFTVGVQGADMQILNDIASPTRPPMMLRGLRFRDLFHWLSASMRRVSVSQINADVVMLPSVESWAVLEA